MAPKRRSLSLGLHFIRRELGAHTAIVISVFTALVIASSLLSAAPRLFEEVSAEDLYATVSEPDPALRNIRVERFGRFGSGPDGDPFVAVRGYGEGLLDDQFPRAVREVISSSYYVVESPRFQIRPLPGEDAPHPFRMFLRFRYQEHIEDHIDLVAGEMPEPQQPVELLLGPDCPVDPAERAALEAEIAADNPSPPIDGEDMECSLDLVPHYQVAVSEQTSKDLGLEIGQQMLLTPDSNDRLFFGISGEALRYPLVMSISGLIGLDDLDDEYWYADDSLHRPGIQENADLRIIFATGLMSPLDNGSMGSAMGEASRNHTWRYFVDPDRVAAADVAGLQSELVPFEAHFAPIAARPIEPRVITQLSDLLAAHIDQQAETLAMMSLTVAGMFSVVVMVIMMLALLMTERQTRPLVLLRNRGGSGGQLTLTRLYETLLLALPAVVLGYLVAGAVFAGTSDFVAYRITVALSVTTIVVFTAAVVPLAWRRLGRLQRDEAINRSSGTRRVVLEVLIVTLALGATILLRRRGQIDDSVNTGFDLLLAVTPALLGVAAGLVALRLYPVIIRSLSWLTSKARGVVGYVGIRRVLHGTTASRLPVLAIVVCTATATFSSVIFTSIGGGQDAASWQVVGGDYSVKGFGTDTNIPSSVDLESLDDIDIVAYARTTDGRLDRGNTSALATVVALDAGDYSLVTEGTAGDIDLPTFLTSDIGPDPGSESTPIPVVASNDWPEEMGVSVGETFLLDLRGLQPHVVVQEIRDQFPDVVEEDPFVILSYQVLESINDLPLPPTVAYLRAEPSAGTSLETGVAEQSSSARFISRYEVLDSVATDPFVYWVGAGLKLVFVFASIFAVVSALSSLAIASSRRRMDFGYLRTLGLDASQVTLMTIVEQVPPLLTGTMMGVLTGAGTALVLAPTVDLAGFTGSDVPAPMTIDWTWVTWLGVALAGAMALGIVIFVLVNRRGDLGEVLRVGEE